jgi:hypothetical protein
VRRLDLRRGKSCPAQRSVIVAMTTVRVMQMLID